MIKYPLCRSPLAGHGPGRDALRTTMMLIVLIAVFLSTEIPFMVITVLHVLSTRSVPFCPHMLSSRAGNEPSRSLMFHNHL